ncbi:S-layer protein OS=Lysinibacillus sphaericus OX=1421 GN=LS41612_07045 PE=4 SV=1 [Lysinibacillus sphaericus]
MHDHKITIQFPLKVNDTIYINGNEQKVTKIYEHLSLNITGSYETFNNVVIAGDYIIAKGLVKGRYDYWVQ